MGTGYSVTPAMRQASINAGHEKRVQERKARKARVHDAKKVEVYVPFDGQATLHAVYKKAKELWAESNPFPADQRLKYLKGSLEWRRAVAAWGEFKVTEHTAGVISTDPNISDGDPKGGLGPLLVVAQEIFTGDRYTENQKVNYLLGNYAWKNAVITYGFSLACKTVRKVFIGWDGKERPTWYSRGYKG